MERPTRLGTALSFEKPTQRADLELWSHPLGCELRLLVNGAFTWSRTIRPPEPLRDELQRLRNDFLGRGWSEVPARTSSSQPPTC
jgi:hypothetical protein